MNLPVDQVRVSAFHLPGCVIRQKIVQTVPMRHCAVRIVLREKYPENYFRVGVFCALLFAFLCDHTIVLHVFSNVLALFSISIQF